MRLLVCSMVFALTDPLGCESEPQPLPSPPVVRFDDFRQIQSNPRQYFNQVVSCKVAVRPTPLESTFFPQSHYADDLDRATKMGRIMCAERSHFMDVLVQPSEEGRYFSLRSGQVVRFMILKDRDTYSNFALRFQ